MYKICRNYKKIFLCIGLLFVTGLIQAQNKTITGKVTDSNGEELIGATITIPNTTTGTVTDIDGNYALDIGSANEIKVTYIGYVPKLESVGARSVVDISLDLDIESLEEVIVIGYGSMEKGDVTGAVDQVDSEVLQRLPTSNPAQALQGRMAGVQVSSSAAPGGAAKINIRGVGSVAGDSQPLIVIDGVYPASLNSINSNDIATITVLKDASAAAIYGVQAANGVVIVTTKSGKEGETRIDVNAEYGMQTPTRLYSPMNSRQFADYSLPFHNNSETPTFLQNKWVIDKDLNSRTTDWQDLAFAPAPIFRANMSASSGTENAKYRVGLGYFSQDGILKNTSFERINMSINSSVKKSIFTFGQAANLSYTKEQRPYRVNPFSVLSAVPQMPLYDPTNLNGYGRPTDENSGQVNTANPLVNLDLVKDIESGYSALGNFYGQVDIIKGLTFKSSLNYSFNNTVGIRNNPETDQGTVPSVSLLQEYERRNSNFSMWQYENYFNFDRRFGEHKIGALAGMSMMERQFFGHTTLARNTGGLKTFNTSTDRIVVDYAPTKQRVLSYLSRVNYSFKDKYLVTATLRRDGLSSFYFNGNQWGLFPSYSFGWRVSEESFMQGIPWLADLKIRGGYGALGRPISLDDTFESQSTITYKASYGFGNVVNPGVFPLNASDNDIQWETAKQTNIGMDLAILDYRVNITLDVFRKTSENMILDVEFPDNYGLGEEDITNYGSGKTNIGSINNDGIEFGINYRKKEGEFTYDIAGNFSYINNDVVALSSFGSTDQPISNGSQRSIAGEALWHWYGYKTDGYYQVGETVPDGLTASSKPGDVKIVDVDTNGRIDDGDQTILGNSIPKFYYGTSFFASYKSFDLSILLEGKAGFTVKNNNYNNLTNTSEKWVKSTDIINNMWTPENTNAEFPRLGANGFSYNFNDRQIQKGTYLSVQNIQLGYDLNSTFNFDFAKKFRVYISLTNPIILTNYIGYNPDVWNGETEVSTDISVEGSRAMPFIKTYMAGLQLTF